MEYVEGQSLLRWRRERERSVEQLEDGLPVAREAGQAAERTGYAPVQAEAHHRLGRLLDEHTAPLRRSELTGAASRRSPE